MRHLRARPIILSRFAVMCLRASQRQVDHEPILSLQNCEYCQRRIHGRISQSTERRVISKSCSYVPKAMIT
ncbi:hypothetical protein FB567DRAFT_539118 [Paraphoma chrysanthemicola]|uniref:Uncharacterized protein n=1 Tax=Paraphoma chrysanthemicola TaxID=798071 RepID=A0A8K0VSL3_9PLEO|nr:hypothetical protein FB567DRAFT_539118 [Paraphoma chrysanthemicola]